MSSLKTRHAPWRLYPIAQHLVELLEPACERLAIVGSLRRCRPWELDNTERGSPFRLTKQKHNWSDACLAGIADVEILAVSKEAPVMRRSLFPDYAKAATVPTEDDVYNDPRHRGNTGDPNALDLLVDKLVRDPNSGIIWDPALRRRGPKYKRLAYDGCKARSLPGAANHSIPIPIDLFVCTPPASWGCLEAIRTGPADFTRLLVTPRHLGGALPSHLVFVGGALRDSSGWIQPATEEEFFAAVGLPHWPPAERSAEKLRNYVRRNDSAGEEPQC